MIVPQYWAESRVQHRQRGQQITVRRFGWSDASQDEAQANADQRAAAALQRLLTGEKLIRSEPKVAYNGADGVPIREEIVSRHGEAIVTRNSYGARCLNVANALFADVDFYVWPAYWISPTVLAVSVLIAIVVGLFANSIALGAGLVAAGMVLAFGAAKAIQRSLPRLHDQVRRAALDRLLRFLDQNPAWNLRVYRTPAGLRLLATHQPFAAGDPAVAAFFRAIGADPVYAQMCLHQQCFRARVSPKPWRIGIKQHVKPRPGLWPVPPDRVAARNAWIAAYEDAAQSFAACTYIDSIGSGMVHPEVRPIQELHDDLCRATSGLPIA